jgi:GGDEF domain-containing protein
VLLPGCPPEDAFVVAERLRSAMPGGQTCSLGVATWDGTATSSQLYAIADSALYRAKTTGRDRAEAGPGGEPLTRA